MLEDGSLPGTGVGLPQHPVCRYEDPDQRRFSVGLSGFFADGLELVSRGLDGTANSAGLEVERRSEVGDEFDVFGQAFHVQLQ